MLPLMCQLVSASMPADHAAVRETIIAAFNNFSSVPSTMLALLDDDADWCDPYPACVHGKSAIGKFLSSMPPGTDTIILAEPMVTVGPVGGMMATFSFSWPGAAESCLYTADQHVSWELATTTADSTPTLAYVRWVYNASEFDEAISGCLGPAAACRAQSGGEEDREADLQKVKDYIVSLQRSIPQQALICDLLVPTARYCDPYPVRCATGRSGCRAMKGLPPSSPPSSSSPSVQTRPASVRPLMPTGPVTGATYIAYSSAERNSRGKLAAHKLHHTWAVWELAPLNGSTPGPGLPTPPAPMLASFDWFMPEHNI